ncbi:hypothetical protein AV521_32200 [Streptomyces sp. IMTB 2501]|nr:hypothetical protein AV521_32200 [Streptomyces sp. IMTB 2501]
MLLFLLANWGLLHAHRFAVRGDTHALASLLHQGVTKRPKSWTASASSTLSMLTDAIGRQCQRTCVTGAIQLGAVGVQLEGCTDEREFLSAHGERHIGSTGAASDRAPTVTEDTDSRIEAYLRQAPAADT